LALNIIHYELIIATLSLEFLKTPIWSIVSIFNLILLLMQMLLHISRSGRVKKFLKFMQNCDEKFNTLQLFIDYQKQRRVIRNKTLLVVALILLRYAQTILMYCTLFKGVQRTSFIQELFCCYFLLYVCTFCLQFIIFTYLVRERIKIITNSLE
jgi:hypothetical protein